MPNFVFIDCRYDTLFLFTFSHCIDYLYQMSKLFLLLFFHQLPVSKCFLFTFFIDYLYQCSSRCLPWRLEPTPELAHLYSDQCQGFARTISTRLYYGCLYSLFFCVFDHAQGGYYFRNQQYIIINIGVLWPI